jgi:diguanylate cyclase (GGDEF)-like protein
LLQRGFADENIADIPAGNTIMNILIAEDEPSLRENLQLMLELEGYAVRAACDGLDALEQARAHCPDLLISDVMMPRLDGFGLVAALRQEAATAMLPIIILSAKADRGDVRQGMTLGADDYLIKPYRREELLEAITARLSRSRQMAQTAVRHQDEIRLALQIDPLTSLPNRLGFEQMLVNELRQHQGAGPPAITVVCLGLDGFSRINDGFGSAVGDLVLCEASRRLGQTVTQLEPCAGQDPLARLAGDCFGICLRTSVAPAALESQVRQLMQVLEPPFEIAGHSLHLNASVGACQASDPSCTAVSLMFNAESAMRHAKPHGPGAYRLFDGALNRQVARRLQIHNELHSAVANAELLVYYQPQVQVETGQLTGFEALARWQHPTLGWVSPAEFIPIAEESGIINQLGESVLRLAAAQAMQWLNLGQRDFRVAVNLSVRQFASGSLPTLVAQVLGETGLPPHMLELEVTESLALQSVASTLGTLHALKALGVKLSMDDFGTGYSSLAYLKRYPLDSLKIDQGFVRNITHDAGDAAITRAIVAMAHSFGMSVIAEGVETPEQLAFLRQLGCEEFQGYLFSRPVPASEALRHFDGYHAA